WHSVGRGPEYVDAILVRRQDCHQRRAVSYLFSSCYSPNSGGTGGGTSSGPGSTQHDPGALYRNLIPGQCPFTHSINWRNVFQQTVIRFSIILILRYLISPAVYV